ncbi:type II secretion system F family protein [Oceanobacillus saliphilus]|uniref:type II secretion system F family protein n=1 Tax=Oceanobacillus saliphilus TaxID=2925834 RepID=UPI00201D5E20|nr:type II secretion system F family protein [Oceanobacillus saliphilus]
MISLYYLLFSMLFFTLITGAILIQIFKKQLVISARTMDYFGIDEEKIKREKKQRRKTTPHFTLLKKMSDQGKYFVGQRMPTSKKKELEQRLREAGYPLNMSPIDFRFLQILIGLIIMIGMYTLVGNGDTGFLSSIFLAGVVSVLGMYFPSFYLSVIIKKRRQEILKSMPDFFDMVNLSIEAGMGLDASLLKVCKQSKGALSEEFLQTLEDMKLGKSRREAFSDLRSRVPVHQFQSIITSLIQADLLGVGMAKVIRSLTERIREQRTQLAREQAMKAPVKMVFPMLLFIFPSMFIVLLGPLVIYLLETI